MTEQVRPPSGFPTSPPPAFPPPQWNGPAQPVGPPPMARPPGQQFGPPPSVTQPSARWGLSIVAVLFSFLFGAIALYFSSQVGTRWQQGDVAGAEKASSMAQLWSIVAIVVGVLAILVLAGGSA